MSKKIRPPLTSTVVILNRTVNQGKALQLLVENNLLSPHFNNARDIGICIQSSKLLRRLAFQFHACQTLSLGSYRAWLRGRFVSWKEASLDSYISFDIAETLIDCKKESREQGQLTALRLPPWEKVYVRVEGIAEYGYSPLDTFDNAFEELHWFQCGILEFLRSLPNLKDLTVDCTNTWGEIMYALDNTEESNTVNPFSALETLRTVNYPPELLFTDVGIKPSNYFLGQVVDSNGRVTQLETLIVEHSDLQSFNTLLEYAASGQHPNLRNLYATVWCLVEDDEFVDWDVLDLLLPQLITVSRTFYGKNKVGRTRVDILDGFQLQTLPPALTKFEIFVIGMYQGQKPDSATTVNKYRSLLSNPVVSVSVTFDDLPASQ